MKFQSLFIVAALLLTNSGTARLDDLEDYGIFGRLTQVFRIIVDTARTFLQLNKKPLYEDVTFWCANREEPNFRQVYISQGHHDSEFIRSRFNDTIATPQGHREPHSSSSRSRSVAFLIHGYLENYKRNWIRDTVDEYLKFVDGHICAVDWNYMAILEYSMSARRTQVVGNYLADFIEALVNTTSVQLDDVLLVGFSMGAHVAGVAGKRFHGQIPLIIGLDPAGFSFTKFPLVPLDRRLDPSDAQFVQVLHTDKNNIGTNLDCGHTDYYPNNGENYQPGCRNAIIESRGFEVSATCSHLRATQIFRASLNPASKIRGKLCSDWETYEKSQCAGNETDAFGLYAKNNLNGRLFFETSADPPFME